MSKPINPQVIYKFGKTKNYDVVNRFKDHSLLKHYNSHTNRNNYLFHRLLLEHDNWTFLRHTTRPHLKVSPNVKPVPHNLAKMEASARKQILQTDIFVFAKQVVFQIFRFYLQSYFQCSFIYFLVPLP